jgi:pimeloyl-ACP methyl ester carboxylesterase
MAVFVLVHGGSHGGWCYQKVARLLQAAGHVVYTPTLTGLADRKHLLTPETDLETHVIDIANLVEFEDLTDVILVGHSYGGMVITGAADRLPDRVGHRVYLDAAYPGNGESMMDCSPPALREVIRQFVCVVDGVEGIVLPDNLHGVTDPAMLEWMRPRLTPHPWKSADQKLALHREAEMRAIPESHIICVGTLGIRDLDALKASSDGRVWISDAGHDVMLIEPEWVVEKLEIIAAKS